MVTCAIRPSSAEATNSLKMISGSFACCLLKRLKSYRNINPKTNHNATFREN